MVTKSPTPHSELFLVRIWAQPDAGGEPGWQGKLQPMLSGEVHYFADWEGLVALLVQLVDPGTVQEPNLAETGAPPPDPP